MVVVEVVIVALVLALAAASTAAAYAGLLGVIGAVRLVRCNRCGHLGAASVREPLRTCPYCRHGVLLHPLYAIHHARGMQHSAQR